MLTYAVELVFEARLVAHVAGVGHAVAAPQRCIGDQLKFRRRDHSGRAQTPLKQSQVVGMQPHQDALCRAESARHVLHELFDRKAVALQFVVGHAHGDGRCQLDGNLLHFTQKLVPRGLQAFGNFSQVGKHRFERTMLLIGQLLFGQGAGRRIVGRRATGRRHGRGINRADRARRLSEANVKFVPHASPGYPVWSIRWITSTITLRDC